MSIVNALAKAQAPSGAAYQTGRPLMPLLTELNLAFAGGLYYRHAASNGAGRHVASKNSCKVQPGTGALRLTGSGETPGLCLGHNGADLFRRVFPAVDLLLRADEDLHPGTRHAEPCHVNIGDVAHVLVRIGQGPQHGEIPYE